MKKEMLKQIYIRYKRETNTAMKDVNFTCMVLEIHSVCHFNSFVDSARYKSEGSDDASIVAVINYILMLSVKLLGHSFVNHHLQQLQKNPTEPSRGLRHDFVLLLKSDYLSVL